MASVDFRIKNLKAADGTKATLAEVTGSIDATSIVQFQNVMDKLVEKAVRNLILDCANVKYINSTGLGTLLKYVDAFESMDGHIAFTRVPSKVMLVMEMLGFNALFTIVPDEAAALRKFSGRPAAAPAAAPSIQPAAPSITRPAGPSSHAPTIKPAHGHTAFPIQPAQPDAVPAAAGAGYPTVVDCVRCRLALEVSGPGKYKCPRCESVLVSEPSGRSRFFAPKGARPVSVSLPAKAELLDGIGPLVESAVRDAGFNGATVRAIRTAVVSAGKSIIELAYSGDSSSSIHVLIVPEESEITIRMSDYGSPIPSSGGVPQGGGFGEIEKLMDTVQVKPNPKGGNLITMTKRRG
jgi:anti-sigma B factor antagonist